ncbi:MAG TPA: beta-eliminating lyase-related protein [Devosia sp.]|nr:beta-eliminating lyase-related protein [Devosia sp.]
MNFTSDNWAGATAAVMDALQRANGGFAPAYGNDPLTASVTRRFSEIFEREVEVHFIATGTGANAVCMAATARPGGLVFCSAEAHIHSDEYNAAEFFTGMKLMPLASDNGLLIPETLEAAVAKVARSGPPTTLSLTNASELGTVYRPDRIAALGAIAKARGMLVHIDGARFGNAVAATGASPAELTWKSGADLMSFGGTKNGCFGAEAIIVFEPGRFPDIGILRQRAGHGMSKTRFMAAQFEGYFADGAWLKTAAHANRMTARLADGIAKSNAARLPFRGEANELFPIVSNATAARLRAAGAAFHTWEELPGDEQIIRLVTSFATPEADVERFLALL